MKAYKQLFAQVFVIGVALLCAAGVSLAYSTWSGPTAAAPGNNTDTPLNTGVSNQVKSGTITAGVIGAPSVCIGTDCRSAWPTGGTSQWTTSGSNIYYGSGNVGIQNTAFSAPLEVGGSGANNYGGTPEIYANGDNHTGGGIAVSGDGGFYDYNDGWITYNGSTGLKIGGNNGQSSTGGQLYTTGGIRFSDGTVQTSAASGYNQYDIKVGTSNQNLGLHAFCAAAGAYSSDGLNVYVWASGSSGGRYYWYANNVKYGNNWAPDFYVNCLN